MINFEYLLEAVNGAAVVQATQQVAPQVFQEPVGQPPQAQPAGDAEAERPLRLWVKVGIRV
jgi:hypothetical protein